MFYSTHEIYGPAGILRYVPQFREKTFVVAVDGAVVGDDNFGNLLMDVAVLWSLNIRTVLVHGAAAQIQALADGGGPEPSDLEGSGVTDADTLQLALTAANRLTHGILESLSTADLQGASTNAVIAHPLGILRGVDHLFTGRVERVDRELLARCWRTASSPWCRRWGWTATATPTGSTRTPSRSRSRARWAR